jgi:hypothetical protein
MTNTLPFHGECTWLDAKTGEYVSGTFHEHDAAMKAEQANPTATIAVIEKKIQAAAQATTPAAIVEKVKVMSEPQLQGLARAIAARAAEIRLDQPKSPKGARPQSAFAGSTGLARACAANRNFKVAASAPKPSIPAGLTGLARATAANKARQPK